MNQRPIKQIMQWRLVIILALIPLILIFRPLLWPGGFGFGASQSITSTIEKDQNGIVTNYTEIKQTDSGKTFWDWLSLLGVPISLLLLGSFLQNLDKKRLEKQQKQDSEIAKDLQRQKALKDYFNEVEVLLLDQDWNFKNSRFDKIKILLRAKTLHVLGELDGKRKGSLVKFLVESKVIEQYPCLLRSADLSNAKLFGINLSNADLSEANLYKADLFVAVLTEVDFTGTNLTRADLRGALLCNSIFDAAILVRTDFKDAILSSARQFEASSPATKSPYLCNSRFPYHWHGEVDLNLKELTCNGLRNCKEIPKILVERGYFKNADEAKKHMGQLSREPWNAG